MTSRYIRQTLLSEIGTKGQQRLADAHIAVIGCGGLGSIAAPYLAGAGVGKLTLIDPDRIDITNLHRQVFYSENDNRYKSTALAGHISRLNSEVEIVVIEQPVSKDNIAKVLVDVTIVLECTDDIWTKYLVNDYCHIHRIPVVYGAIHKFDGQVTTFENKDEASIHLRDIYPDPNEDIPTCSEVGVLSTLAALIGVLQANEAIKHITGAGTTLYSTLLCYDILSNDQMKLKLKKNYASNLVGLYDNTTYQSMKSCDIPTISYSEVCEHRNRYHLVSILEADEHIALDEHIIHLPLSTIDVDMISQPQSNTVYYCKTGQRSQRLVGQLMTKYTTTRLYSLAGGYVAK